MSDYPTSWKEAKRTGATYYRTGKACKYGHVAARYANSGTCVECQAAKTKAWFRQNPGYYRDYYRRNPDKERASSQRFRDRNIELARANRRSWGQKNPGKQRAYCMRRHAAKLQRTPPWADQDRITAVYESARKIQDETGVAIHVDHVLPLQGEEVSGLHCEANLQLLPADENLSKNNRLIE